MCISLGLWTNFKINITEPRGIPLLSPTPFSLSPSEINNWKQRGIMRRGSSPDRRMPPSSSGTVVAASFPSFSQQFELKVLLVFLKFLWNQLGSYSLGYPFRVSLWPALQTTFLPSIHFFCGDLFSCTSFLVKWKEDSLSIVSSCLVSI